MGQYQTGILAPVPRHCRYMTFKLVPEMDPLEGLKALQEIVDGESTVVGIGQSLLNAIGKIIPDMCNFPVLTGPGIEIPSTPASLWCWLRGDDRGELLHRSRRIEQALAIDFKLDDVIDSFMYADSRDLSGYIDGTENPQDDDAIAAAISTGTSDGIDGSSFVAVQQWRHDLNHFQEMSEAEQDDIIGRHQSDNEEFDEAPESAHVKRSAQESFEPEAFIVRRSMPWVEGMDSGLMFVAFGQSFDAFEAILNRMIGAEDGITDALFSFTQPITGAYFWCPPIKDGKLDLRALL